MMWKRRKVTGFRRRGAGMGLAALLLGAVWSFGVAMREKSVFVGPSRGELVPASLQARQPQEDEIVEVLPKDRIPAIFHPQFVSAEKARIEKTASVIGYAEEGEAHAYALNLLDGHEIVNDVVGGRKIATTWCPLCRTALIYSRELEGQTLTFGVSGKLWHNALVMYDRETGSLWSHVTGEAIDGKWKGKRLTMLAGTPRITWDAWRRRYPKTRILSVNGEEDALLDRYADYQRDPKRTGLFPVRRPDTRAAPKERVIGLAIGKHSKAYRTAGCKQPTLLTDTLGGTSVLVYYAPETGESAVYRAPDKGPFRLEGETIQGADGKWQAATGAALGKGADLQALPHTQVYWFAWAVFYPRTDLHP